MVVGHWKRNQAFKTQCLRKLLCISYLEHKINDWVQDQLPFVPTGTSSHRCRQTETGMVSGMLCATTASPKPSFRAHQRVGDTLVSRENAGWKTSRVIRRAYARAVHNGPSRKDWKKKKVAAYLSLISPLGNRSRYCRKELSILSTAQCHSDEWAPW